ncbi:MAG: hypothetical protein ACR2P1_17610, partial [Pseudomonadales bacterium]
MKYTLTLIALLLAQATYAATPTSVGALEFANDNTLFVADSDGGRVFAYTLPNAKPTSGSASYNLIGFGQSIARKFGVSDRDLIYHDIATHPVSGEIWISLTVNENKKPRPAIVRANTAGHITIVDLSKLSQTAKRIDGTANDGVKFWRDIPATTLAITDLDYVDGTLYVSGLSTGEFASTLRQIPYPFKDANDTTHIEIYHTVHDQIETRAPIRAMTVLDLDGEQTVVAAYTCTPLVTIPTKALKDGANVRGKTVAELGYGNTPLDVIQFTAPNQQEQPEDYVLIVHKERNADLIRVADLAATSKKDGLSTPEMWGHAGVPSRALPLSGVLQVADQDAQYIATLKRNIETGDVDLVSFRKGAYFRLSDFISEYNFPDYQYPAKQDFFR